MSKQSEAVIRWRKNTKLKMVAAMGGCCQVCGYFKCEDALEFHHIDPSKKELSFGGMRANPKSIAKIAEELKKCIMLCSNCHKEFHSGLIELPETYAMLDEDIIFGKRKCLECGGDVYGLTKNRYCSRECSGKVNSVKNRKSVFDGVDILGELKYKSKVQLAKELGCSEAAVRKRLKKYS